MPISWDVKGIWGLDSGPSFEGFFERFQRFKCLETGSSRARDRLKSVCLSVCLSFFFGGDFSSRSDAILKAISRKNTSKRGDCEGRERRTGLILDPSPTPASSVVGTLLKLRLRRHLPRGFILVSHKLRLSSSRKTGNIRLPGGSLPCKRKAGCVLITMGFLWKSVDVVSSFGAI